VGTTAFEPATPVRVQRLKVVKTFIPIYPNTLPTLPKPSRANRMASLVVSNLEASQSAITRLENRWARKGPGGSNPSSSAMSIKPTNITICY
jgi:hypothetical protein